MGAVRMGGFLHEVCDEASCVAAAMLVVLRRVVVVFAAAGLNVFLHANQFVAAMVVVGHDRHHQHHHADEKQEISDLPFCFHTLQSLPAWAVRQQR